MRHNTVHALALTAALFVRPGTGGHRSLGIWLPEDLGYLR
jgi:hypothetical protein